MQKKQKPPRKARRKKQPRARSIKHLIGLRRSSSKSTVLPESDKTSDLSVANDLQPHDINIEDFNFLAGEPIFEVRSRAGVSTKSIAEILAPAWQAASSIVAAEIKGFQQELVYLLGQYPELNIQLRFLTKLLLLEKIEGSWALEFNCVDNEGRDSTLHFDIPDFNGSQSRESAEAFLIRTMAELIVESGKEFPQNSIQERTFVFEDLFIPITSEAMNTVKTEPNLEYYRDTFSFDKADESFREIRWNLPEEYTIENLLELSDFDKMTLKIYACLSLQHGERCWPFKHHETDAS